VTRERKGRERNTDKGVDGWTNYRARTLDMMSMKGRGGEVSNWDLILAKT